MRIIKIIFFSLLALILIACTGIFIFFETFDTDQYLPKLTQQVSLALGRPVSIGHVGLGFSWHGITLDAGPVTVADDITFTTQPFIKIDRVRISLDLGSLILRREIHITNVLLQSPQIHLIRSQEGNINIGSILHRQPDGFSHPEPRQSKLPFAEQKIGNIGSQVNSGQDTGVKRPNGGDVVSTIIMQDAAISFIDQSPTMPLDIWLMDIDASLKDFSMSKPFQLSFNTSPLLLKGISPGDLDSPILKNITGSVRLNRADLTASGGINITGGVIKNFNIIKVVLSHTLGVFGNMDGIIDKLGTDDTVIDKAQVQFSFHDKTVFIDDFLIATNILELTAKGSVEQGLNLDLETMLRLNTNVSATLVNEINGLKLFCDDSNRIAIGGNLKGAIPHLKFKPNKDFRKKSKKVLMEEGGNILGVLFGGLK